MIRRLPPAIGLPGLAALLALVLALPLATYFTPLWQQEAAALRQARARQPVPRTVPALAEPQLPAAGDTAERVADLLALALQHGVAVDRTQQRLDSGMAVPALQLTFTARGSYADLRAFIAAALQADPALALQRLQWRRTTAGAADLDADLRWSLLEPAAAARTTP